MRVDDGNQGEVKVSVTVLTYNHARFIADCLDSILAQKTTFAFEAVVGDDCSTDGTTQILREYQRRYPAIIKLVTHATNVGVARNWQDVLDAARGQYIAHLDGDDMMLPGKLQVQADLLDQQPEIAGSFHNMRVVGESGRLQHLFTAPGVPAVHSFEDIVREGTLFCHSSKMYRRTALGPAGLDRQTRHVMDWLTHIQQATTGPFAYIDATLGVYRRHPNGTTQQRSPTELLQDQLYTIAVARNLGASEETVRIAQARVMYAAALAHLDRREWPGFRSLIRQSVGTSRLSSGQRLAYLLRQLPWLVLGLYKVYSSGALAYSRFRASRRA